MGQTWSLEADTPVLNIGLPLIHCKVLGKTKVQRSLEFSLEWPVNADRMGLLSGMGDLVRFSNTCYDHWSFSVNWFPPEQNPLRDDI